MRTFFQGIVISCAILIGAAAVFVYLTDKHVIVYNDGTIQTVDDKEVIFLNDGTILYDHSVIEQGEIKDYSKKNITS